MARFAATVEGLEDDGDYSDVQEYAFNPQPGDVIIALMGVTGVGKSTFISHCTDEPIAVNTGLRSCTEVVTAYRCRLGGLENVYLIDTPGFDDTYRSDIQVLTEIADWLTDTYRRDVKLSGIIYLHRITDLRMAGSARENYLRFQRLCGPEALRKVILATSMWEGVAEAVGEAREKELADTEEFWGYMLRHHSQMHQHYNTVESVRRLIGVFAGSAAPEPISLQLQEEIVDQGMTLIETQVGRGWEEALDKEREKYRKELEEIRAALKEQMSKELKELEEHMQQKLDKSEKDRAALASSLEDKSRSHTKELETVKKELGSVSENLQTEKGFTRRVVKSLEDHAKGLDLRTRSRPTGENYIKEDIHISIHNRSFAFCGPRYTVIFVPWGWITLIAGKNVKDKPHHWTTETEEGVPHIVCEIGWNGDTLVHYSKTPEVDSSVYSSPVSEAPEIRSCHTEMASYQSNTKYPDAQSVIKTLQPYSCINHISLGHSSSKDPFYMEVKQQEIGFLRPTTTLVYKQATPGFPEEDEDAVRRIWWGYNSTYVVERKDGSRTWSLGSHYPGLSDFIRWGIKGCNTIKALALDRGNEGRVWIIIFTNGEVAYTRRGAKSEDKFDHFEFEEFATRNFGCDFGLIEESKMEGTPRSSNPIDMG